MPIRFRCAYCNQLMGISHRKMGTIVRCPKCSGQVVVPQIEGTPDDDASAQDADMSAAVRALEDPELELLLAGAAGESPGMSNRKLKPKGPPKAILEIDVEPLDAPPPLPPSAAIEPSSSQPMPIESPSAAAPAIVKLPSRFGAAAAVLLLMGLAFLVGFLFGKQH